MTLAQSFALTTFCWAVTTLTSHPTQTYEEGEKFQNVLIFSVKISWMLFHWTWMQRGYWLSRSVLSLIHLLISEYHRLHVYSGWTLPLDVLTRSLDRPRTCCPYISFTSNLVPLYLSPSPGQHVSMSRDRQHNNDEEFASFPWSLRKGRITGGESIGRFYFIFLTSHGRSWQLASMSLDGVPDQIRHKSIHSQDCGSETGISKTRWVRIRSDGEILNSSPLHIRFLLAMQ